MRNIRTKCGSPTSGCGEPMWEGGAAPPNFKRSLPLELSRRLCIGVFFGSPSAAYYFSEIEG